MTFPPLTCDDVKENPITARCAMMGLVKTT
nr:MAG TPA: hypothetical protein [Caudoviricetes sp.]